MSYPKELKEQAMTILLARRTAAKSLWEKNKNAVFQKIPQVKEIERQLYNTGLKVARGILESDNVAEMVAQLERENLDLQRIRAELLMENEFPLDFLEIPYTCKKCNDTGYNNDGICDCLKKLLTQLAYKKLGEEAETSKYTFDNFSLGYYPNSLLSNSSHTCREVMESHYKRCMDYARNFSHLSPSLLFLGGTGLGKTHLSIAIAGVVVQQGFGLIYSSAQNLLYKLERQRFSKDTGSEHFTDYLQLILNCDLLIIDDLGAEFSTSFTASTIYNIVNSRLLQGKPTIISSNLDSTKLLEERYTVRFVSRIIGNYTIMKFQGEDIRILKKTNYKE